MMGAPYLSCIYLIIYGVGPLLVLADNKELLPSSPVRFPTALSGSETVVSPQCYNDSQIYLLAYSNKEKWASQSKYIN